MVINCTAEMECKSQTIDVAAVEKYFNVRDWRSEELQGGVLFSQVIGMKQEQIGSQ